MNKTAAPKTIDEYIRSYPREIRQLLQSMRQTIKKAAPKAEETISYKIPAFRLNGMLVWFAAFKNHIGFYPGVGAMKVFKDDLLEYKGAKGSVQFPFDKALPLPLVSRIVKFRVKQNLSRR
jgi:uncharacterized protein YdhG (YjbR/CyaY superfamily)